MPYLLYEDIKLIPDDAPKMPGQFRTQKDKVLADDFRRTFYLKLSR